MPKTSENTPKIALNEKICKNHETLRKTWKIPKKHTKLQKPSKIYEKRKILRKNQKKNYEKNHINLRKTEGETQKN